LIKTRFIAPPRNESVVKGGSPQTDAQPGAGDLQRVNGHADQLGNFLSALASLHQIFYLLDSLRRKLYWPPPTLGRHVKLPDLGDCCTLCAFFFKPRGLLSIGAVSRPLPSRMRLAGAYDQTCAA
jgi:hypothetical protein